MFPPTELRPVDFRFEGGWFTWNSPRHEYTGQSGRTTLISAVGEKRNHDPHDSIGGIRIIRSVLDLVSLGLRIPLGRSWQGCFYLAALEEDP